MSMRDDIIKYIKTTLVTQSSVEIAADTDLLDTGAVDSVAMMEMIVWIEEAFDVQIDPEDLTPDNFGTVNAMAQYIEQAKASG